MSEELRLPEKGSRWVRNGFDIPKNSKFKGTVVTVLRIGRTRRGVTIVHYLRDGNKTPSYWYLGGFFERYSQYTDPSCKENT